MAYLQRWVTETGGGLHDGTSEVNAWTFDEYKAATLGPGYLVNIKNGAYSSAGFTMEDGTLTQLNALVAYNVTPGDLYFQKRNLDGSLDTTNFPTLTLTGGLAPGSYSWLFGLKITGAISDQLIDSTAADYVHIGACEIINTQDNASAGGVILDNYGELHHCDVRCTGANHGTVLQADNELILTDVVVQGTDTDATLVTAGYGTFDGCVLYGGANSVAINVEGMVNTWYVKNTTIYGVGTAVLFPNTLPSKYFYSIDNHITDCTEMYDSLYEATGDMPVIEVFTRTRDNTTPRTGISDETIRVGEVTTDTGGPATDYTDSANGDFSLINGAPGVDAGIGVGTWNIGAAQNARAASAGGGLLIHPGMNGGLNG